MGWTELRDALQAGIVAASGLAADHVIWKFQDAAQPAGDYIALGFGSLITVGQDGIQATTDLTRPAGQEVKLDVLGMREATLTVECYSSSVADANDALARAETVRTKLILPSVRGLFAAQGVTPFDPGSTNYVPSIVAAGFRGRAVLDVRCAVPAQAAFDLIGYIATATNGLTAHGGVIDPESRTFTAP